MYIKTRSLSLKPVLRTIARRIFASDRPMQTERVQNERPQGLQNALFLLQMCGNCGKLCSRKAEKKKQKKTRSRAFVTRTRWYLILDVITYTHTHTQSLFFCYAHAHTLLSLFLSVLLVVFFFIAVSNGVHREAETIGADDHSRGSSEGWTLSAEGRFAGE